MRVVSLGVILLLAATGLASCGDDSSAESPSAPASGNVRDTKPGPTGIPDIADRPEIWTGALGRFLNQGPTEGTWAVQAPTKEWVWYFESHPRHQDQVIVAPVYDGETGKVSAISRLGAPLFFYEAPAWMFTANYRQEGLPRYDVMPDGRRAVRAAWRPVHHTDGLTERIAWFADDGKVLQIEDYSRTGFMVRRVRRVLDSKAEIDPADIPSELCCPTMPKVASDDMARASAAPFRVYTPAFLPRGYALVRVVYEDGPLNKKNPIIEPSVQRVSLLYSDGMGIISMAIAPPDHMDAITRHVNKMPVRGGNTDVCPTLSGQPKDLLASRTGVIRMSSDRCRTVLRRDNVGDDLSVMLIGRNELSTETYLRIVQSLKPYKPPAFVNHPPPGVLPPPPGVLPDEDEDSPK